MDNAQSTSTHRKVIDTQQVAQILALSAKTIRSWRFKEIYLPYMKLGDAIRYYEDDILAFRDQHFHAVEKPHHV